MDLQDMMRQAQSMQTKMKDDLAKMALEGSSGGGGVKVVINGNKELTQIEIDPEAAKDSELLADLILAAMNAAYQQANQQLQNHMQGQLSQMMGNLDLSGLSDLFKK